MALTRSLLHTFPVPSLAFRPSVRSSVMLSGDAAIMPDLPSSLPLFLRSFVRRSLRGRLHAHFLCNVGDSQPKQKQPTLLRPPPTSLPPLPHLPPARRHAHALDEGRGRRSTIPSSIRRRRRPRRPCRPTDRRSVHRQQAARKTSIARTHSRQGAHRRTDSLLLLFGSPYLQFIMNWDSDPKSGATGLFVVLQYIAEPETRRNIFHELFIRLGLGFNYICMFNLLHFPVFSGITRQVPTRT